MERRDLDPFAGLRGTKDEYNVYDAHYEKLGKVDDLLVDTDGRALYIGVKMGGLFGANSTIVPVEIVRVNDKRHLVEVSEPAESIKRAPHFGHGDDLTPEMENHVRSYYGLEALRPSPEHDPQGVYVTDDDPRFAPDNRVDVFPGERAHRQERTPNVGPEIPADPGPERRAERPSEPPLDRPVNPAAERPAGSPVGRPSESTAERSVEGSGTRREGRWEPETTVGGVKIHRVRR